MKFQKITIEELKKLPVGTIIKISNSKSTKYSFIRYLELKRVTIDRIEGLAYKYDDFYNFNNNEFDLTDKRMTKENHISYDYLIDCVYICKLVNKISLKRLLK